MVGQYLPQTNEKCYSVLQCPMWLFASLFPPSKHSPSRSKRRRRATWAKTGCWSKPPNVRSSSFTQPATATCRPIRPSGHRVPPWHFLSISSQICASSVLHPFSSLFCCWIRSSERNGRLCIQYLKLQGVVLSALDLLLDFRVAHLSG